MGRDAPARSVFFGQYTSGRAWALGRSSRCSSYRQEATPISQARARLPRYAKESLHAAGALHDTPSGLLPFQKVAVHGCKPMLTHPLPSKLVASVKQCYTPFGQELLGRHSHYSSGPFAVGATASHNDIAVAAPWPRPVLPTKGRTQCDPYYTIDQTDEKHPPCLASNPQFKALFGAYLSSMSSGPS